MTNETFLYDADAIGHEVAHAPIFIVNHAGPLPAEFDTIEEAEAFAASRGITEIYWRERRPAPMPV